jgi:hypothetical protein
MKPALASPLREAPAIDYNGEACDYDAGLCVLPGRTSQFLFHG